MFKFYRMMPSGKWKYTETYNSTLDPEYHADINYLGEQGIDWKLVATSNNTVLFSSKKELIGTKNE